MLQRLALPALALLLPLRPATPQEGEPAAPTPAENLAAMDWLAGAWSGPMWGGTFEAHYSTPAGGRILSHSRLVRDEAEAFYQFEVFEPGETALNLNPFPGGRRATGFELTELDRDTRKAVFENPDKDYPTRIVYQRVAEDTLVITLSDPHGDSERTERFDLQR